VHDGHIVTEVLHDVDLAAGGPANFVDVLAEHPKAGSQPARRQLYARLDQAVRKANEAFCDQPSRGVLPVVVAESQFGPQPVHRDGQVAFAIEASIGPAFALFIGQAGLASPCTASWVRVPKT
jgi:hypothetical protein